MTNGYGQLSCDTPQDIERIFNESLEYFGQDPNERREEVRSKALALFRAHPEWCKANDNHNAT